MSSALSDCTSENIKQKAGIFNKPVRTKSADACSTKTEFQEISLTDDNELEEDKELAKSVKSYQGRTIHSTRNITETSHGGPTRKYEAYPQKTHTNTFRKHSDLLPSSGYDSAQWQHIRNSPQNKHKQRIVSNKPNNNNNNSSSST